MSSKSSRPSPYRPNLWGFLRDVFLAAIGRGQLVVATIGLLVIIIFLRLETKKLTEFVFLVYSDFKDIYLLGWILFFVSLIAWFYSNRFQRRSYAREMDRIGKEKTKLMELLTERKQHTSNLKKV